MTRFARAGKRKFLEASSWDALRGSQAVHANLTPKETNESSSSPKQVKTFQKKNKNIVLRQKREKQIEARRLRRKKGKICFVCRKCGHQASECPNKDEMRIGTCFKCGSSDHTTRKCKDNVTVQSSGSYPFAKCFICHEMGHLAKSCSENPRGLYPLGGGCKICGSVEHLKRDCPQLQNKKQKGNGSNNSLHLTSLKTSSHTSADAEDNVETTRTSRPPRRKHKIVHF